MAAATAASFPVFASAPAATEEQSRAMADLVFDLPREDVWTLALMMGVRSNDVADRKPSDLGGLIHVHDDPAQQSAHCIRREEDDGAAGDAGALAACRAFIIGELEAGGLLEDTLDLAATERVSSWFKFRGRYTISLPRFAYRLGRAVHAVEDGYAHAMRDPDTGNVRSVLNWIDAFGKTDYDEDRDGYQHLSGLDDCRRTDSVQQARLRHAREAVTNIIAEIASDRPNRRARVEAAVDAALVLIPNCTPDNDYCNAPELDESKDLRTFGCAIGGSASLLLVFGVVLFAIRRRSSSLLVLALVASPVIARAQEPAPVPAVEEPPAGEAPPKDAPAIVQDRADCPRWHFDARAGGSWDDPGISGALGAAVDWKKWTFGLYGEWNPWFSFDEVGSARPGVANLFLAVSYRWYHSDKIALSTRIEAGSSTMLFELLGIDKYTTGIYLGGALTSVRFPINKHMALTFDPIHFALPAPRPFGLPFYYKQYRVSFGLEVAL